MQIEEFQLRYMGYEGLNERFNFGWDEDTLIKLTIRTNKGKITKKLTEVSPDELKQATLQTYTQFKRNFIKNFGNKKIKGNFTLSDYINRLEYELKVIHEMGYDTYFLIVQDYIMYAKKSGIVVGPGRGSAAGSLLSYLIRITEIDPIEYDLLFERFLNPARISMPDIDTDFEDSERDKILEYCKQKYGMDKVANIGTYMTMAAKASFKDVARVFGMSFTKANQLSNYIEKSISKSYENNEEFKRIVDEDENLQNIIKYASKLEGNVRQLGVHACGVIIAPEKITEYTPIQYPLKSASKEPDKTRIVTQYDGHYLEDIGLLKMDFLGLRNLSIIKNTLKILRAKGLIEDNKKSNLITDNSQAKLSIIKDDNYLGGNLDNLGLSKGKLPSFYSDFFKYYVFEPPIDDEATYRIFQNGDTVGVFQFESDGMRSWLKKLKPTNIDDIIAMVSLYRPGPMEWIPNYINRKQGKEKITYLPEDIYKTLEKKYGKEVAEQQREQITKDLSPFMDITYGIPIYQEQLMRIVQAMAGFSLGEADLLRRGVGKKIKEVIEKLKNEFIEKASKFKNYKEEVSRFVYEKMIEPAANYSFNKSHAACYAIIAYQTAYLKAHHPIEFYAALLRSVEENSDRFAELLEELKLKGVKIEPVNVNKSYNHIAAINNSVVIGFLSIKGIGYEVGKHIEKERKKNGPYKDLEDFLNRNEKYINKKTLESLIKSGALDIFEDRLVLINNIENILNWLKKSQTKKENVGISLFGDELLGKDPLVLRKTDIITDNSNFCDGKQDNLGLCSKKNISTNLMEKLKLEYETFGTFVSAHPLDGLYSYIKRRYNFSTQIMNENYEGNFKLFGFIKNIIKSTKFGGYFIEVEDITGTIRLFLKNIAGISKFDIFIIEGKKQKKLSVSKMYKVNLEKLIEKLKQKGKYKEEETVAVVRGMRKKAEEKKLSVKSDLITDNNLSNAGINKDYNFCDFNEPVCSVAEQKEGKIYNFDNLQSKKIICDKVDNSQKVVYYEIEIDLPEEIEKLEKLAKMKKENPSKKEFELDGKIYLI